MPAVNPQERSRHRQVKEIFEQADGLPPVEREEYLAKACGEDQALRSEVERLLTASADTPDSFLEPRERSACGVSAISIGQQLGHYRVVAQLGSGGMGEVWEAEDSKLKRRVALKVLPADLGEDKERLQRFQREAEAVAALNHPNIVTIHSVEEADGIHFLTMEKIEGQSLDRLISEGGLELDQLFDIVVPMAAAVSAAHEKGITHRDLKPANVMVTDDGHVKVLDFGLAKVQDGDGIASTQLATEGLTAEGVVMGTTSYMSPEQAEGKAVDHRTDIFSLGVVLYEMATGVRPFRGDSAAAVMGSILRDNPRSLVEMRSDLPRHLDRIVDECLQKRPRDRFQSSRDVYNGLRRLQKEVTSETSWSSTIKTSAETAPSRPRWLTLIAGALVTALLASGVWWLTSKDSGEQATDTSGGQRDIASDRKMIAVLPMRNLGAAEDEYFAAGITDEILSRLATVKGLGVVSSGAESTDLGVVRIGSVGRDLGVDYVLTGSVRWARSGDNSSRVRISPKLIRVDDETHLWAEVYDRPIDDIFEIQTEIALNVVRELGAALIEPERDAIESRPTENPEAYQAYMRGIWAADAVDCEFIRDRVVYLHRATEIDPLFAEAWAHTSRAHSGAYAHCAEHAEEDRLAAIRTLDRAKAVEPGSWIVLEAEGKFLTQVERDYVAALEPLRQADALIERWEIKFSLGRIYRRMGDWDRALVASQQALDLFPLNVELTMRVGAIHHWMRNYREALEYYDRAIEEGPQWNNTFLRKAWVYWLWKADLEKAREVLETLPPGEPSPLIQWGWFWQRFYEGDFLGAIDGLDAVPDDQMIGGNIFRMPRALLRGQAYEQMGRRDQAELAYEEAVVALELATEQAPKAQNLLQSLAVAYAGLGRAADAQRIISKLETLVPFATDPYYGATVLQIAALVHTKLGDYDAALLVLDSILAAPSVVSIPWLELDPRWQPLWDLPGYRDLKEKYSEAGT